MSAELQTVLDLISPAVRRSAAAVWQPSGLRERYARYLVEMHAVLRASVPLMELAALRCAQPDPVCSRLRTYFPVHIEQELGHDEWLLGDMAAVGLRPEVEQARPPSVQVARLVGPQYYWINHHHPVALLGYIAVLEGNSPSPELTGLLADRTGLPLRAFHTLSHHAEADPGHSGEVFALLAELDLTAEQRLVVRTSALHTAAALIDLFDILAAPPQNREDPL
ncbi:iron-containing redox enzyme family protein [Kibdelosporangium persicum]|uniref:Long-chain acyl-CoA synthetase n=1 Tax=Kibdelosporangium persicum TaxID=2698649 RepID=A0ABX2FAH6_9PSEU|nr:iron-containing redox enzyme family protein [Kibdelosporangium persicum]NRN67906.1 Long-chain acyl-CoA synthetase [Kibdelosporangium persicum]